MNKKSIFLQKVLSVFLAIAMTVICIPVEAFAADAGETEFPFTYYISSGEQTLCIDGNGKKIGDKVITWPNETTDNYCWQFKSVDGGYQLINRNSNYVLDCTNDSFTQQEANGSASRIWILENADEGGYRLKNKGNDKYVALGGQVYGSGFALKAVENSNEATIWSVSDSGRRVVEAVINGNGTVTPKQSLVQNGASAEFVVTPDKGNKVDSIIVDGNDILGSATENADGTVSFQVNGIIENKNVQVNIADCREYLSGDQTVCYFVENVTVSNDRLCIAGNSLDPNAEILRWGFNENEQVLNYSWKLEETEGGYKLINGNSFLVMDYTEDGKIIQQNENGNISQVWKLEIVDSSVNTYRIINAKSGQYLALQTSSNVTTTSDYDSAATWKLIDSGKRAVEVTIDGNGAVESARALVDNNGVYNITGTINEGYEIAKVLVNGTEISSDKVVENEKGGFTITLENIAVNQSVEITTAAKKTLEDIKREAIAELESYKNKDDYRVEQQQELENAIKGGTNSINAATTEEEVVEALEGAKVVIDVISTDEFLTREEYTSAESAANDFLFYYKEVEPSEFPEPDEYLSDQRESISAIKGGTSDKLGEVMLDDFTIATLEQMKDATIAINKLIAEAKAAIDALPTAADLTVTGVSITDNSKVVTELTMQVDTTYALGVDITGGSKIDKANIEKIWSSDNQEVATVAEDGTVTAVSKGTAIITVKVRENLDSDKYVEATIKITVEPKKYTVCVKNNGATQEIGEFEEWALAKVEAPAAPEGMKFAYWQTDAGKIVCYASNYSFYVMQNVTLEPVYVKDDTTVKEQVTILCTASYNKSKKQLSFTSKRSLPAGYTVVSHGIVITDSKGWKNITDNALELKLGVWRTKKAVATTTGRLGTYVARMTCTASDIWYGRAYVTYRDKKGEEHTVYSDDAAICQVVVN